MINKERGHFLIGFIAWCQSRSGLLVQTDGASHRRPASVLASGSALGSLPSVALSSAQLDRILADRGIASPCKISPTVILNGRSWPLSPPCFLTERGLPATETDEKTDLPVPQAKE